MLKYLIIPLHDNAVSFCHYPANGIEVGKWIEAGTLSQAIRYAMLENLNVQFVYPEEAVPDDLMPLIASIDHADIVPSGHKNASVRERADITVFDSVQSMQEYKLAKGEAYVLRITLPEWLEHHGKIAGLLKKVDRLNVVFTDITGKSDDKLKEYGESLKTLIPLVLEEYKNGHQVQLNLLTDRLMLDKMNNCNAGHESITLGTDGKFYICPAFCGTDNESAGSLEEGLKIKNPQLYRLDHAPICRRCDAWQCRRCVWLNRELTFEVNTPGHEQCVMAHHERNASRLLLEELRKLNSNVLPETSIPELDYLDPFEIFI